MIRWNPKSHLLVHHDPTPRNSYLSSLSFEEARRWHNHPGLLFTELQKGAAASQKGKITPYHAPVSRNTKGGLGTSVMSQFYAIGVRCAIWTLRRRVVRKRSSDPCLSREAWRVELGPDGMAKRVVVAPWFQESLAPIEALIRIGLIFNLQKQVLKNALGSLARLHPLLLLPI